MDTFSGRPFIGANNQLSPPPPGTIVAEVLAYGDRQNRFNPLCITHATILLWLLAHFVVFAIEAAGSQSSNLWVVMIVWWVIGFALVLLLQSVTGYLHTRQNHKPGTRNLWQLGRPQFREIVLASIVSTLVYFTVGILLAVWLGDHRGGECCTKRDVDPVTEPQAYVSRLGVTTASAIACLFASYVYVKVILVHIWPVRTVSVFLNAILFQQSKSRNVSQNGN